jgi:hypothetical protein
MSTRPFNRIRPNLDDLEAREVPAALLHSTWAPTAGQVAVHQPKFVLLKSDATFTLTNATGHTLRFSVQWDGRGALHSYVLAPGQSEDVWVQEINRRFPPTAVVRVANGGAVHGPDAFKVASALVGVGPNGPDGQGPQYTFVPAPDGHVKLVPS